MAATRKAKSDKRGKRTTPARKAAAPAPALSAPPSPGISPFHPIREIGRLRREMERLFEEFGRPVWPFSGERHRALAAEPAFDVYQEKDEVVVKAELPGLDRKDVHVTVDGDLLTVRGEKRKDEQVHDGDYTYHERSYGLLSRSVRLPTDVDAESAAATFKNGVLTMRLPKSDAAKARTRTIDVT